MTGLEIGYQNGQPPCMKVCWVPPRSVYKMRASKPWSTLKTHFKKIPKKNKNSNTEKINWKLGSRGRLYVDESFSLYVRECKLISKQILIWLSAFFGQPHKEENAEMSTEPDEAEPENDQSSEPKLELAREVQIAEVQSTKGYVLFALPKIKSQSHVNKLILLFL